jgi:hypothetical protein
VNKDSIRTWGMTGGYKEYGYKDVYKDVGVGYVQGYVQGYV